MEEVLRGAVVAVEPQASGLRGASRTDAGVHAEGQAVAFDTDRLLPAKAWCLALNQHLPEDVAVRRARAVPAGFAPRFAARGKRYRYRVLEDTLRDPVWRGRAWRVSGPLAVDAMAEAAAAAVGTHDFGAFRAAADERPSSVRTLTRVDVERAGRHVDVVVEGTAFLYNMVRILAGTLVDVGLGKRPPEAIARALASRNRGDAGPTAPAQGLTLEDVDLELPEDAGEPWPP